MRDLFFSRKTLKYIAAALVIIEATSFLAYFYPTLSPLFFSVALLVFVYLTWYQPHLAILTLLAEIMLGSHGYIYALSVSGFNLSIRMAMFTVLLIAAVPHLFKNKHTLWGWAKTYRLWLMWLVVIILAGLNGLYHGYASMLIFNDVNAYAFILMFLPILTLTSAERLKRDLLPLLIVTQVYLAIKTLILVYLFSHTAWQFYIPDLYSWLRDNRLGEFTPTPGGGYRIFMQSQIYFLVAWWLAIWPTRLQPVWQVSRWLALSALFSSGLIISFSRSIWLGWIASICMAMLYLLLTKKLTNLVRLFTTIILSLALGFVIMYAALKFPLPPASTTGSLQILNRFEVTDEAASSRWNLLPPLTTAVKEHLFIGSGFGSSVTYISNDPRVRAQTPSGEYTTTAFEWGYLDQWLKFGLLGLILMLLIGLGLARALNDQTGHHLALLWGLIGLAATHIGTPYLNHPIGLAWLICLAIWCNSIYDSHSR